LVLHNGFNLLNPQFAFRILPKAVIGVGIGLAGSVVALKDGSASETEKERYFHRGFRGLTTLRESFDTDKVSNFSIVVLCY
jgi:hypothetical protein